MSPPFANLIVGSRAGCGVSRELLIARAWAYLSASNVEIVGRVRSKVDRMDLMQDVILDVHRQLDCFSGTTEAEFLGWVKRISSGHVARVHRSYLGAQSRDVNREDCTFDAGACASSNDSVVDSAIQTEEVAWLNCAIDQLPDHHRSVVEQRMEGRTFREIAIDIDRSVDSVQKLWARGLLKLRHALAKRDSGGGVPLVVDGGRPNLSKDSCS